MCASRYCNTESYISFGLLLRVSPTLLDFRNNLNFTIMNYEKIPDYKKLDYMITDLNYFELGGANPAWLLDNNLIEHISEIKRLSEHIYANVPNWVKSYYSLLEPLQLQNMLHTRRCS